MQNDFELISNIFNRIHSRIADEYDSFRYTVEVFDGYQESEILVTTNGVETDNPKIRDDALSPYDCIVELKKMQLFEEKIGSHSPFPIKKVVRYL